jgi:hypothetical protein
MRAAALTSAVAALFAFTADLVAQAPPVAPPPAIAKPVVKGKGDAKPDEPFDQRKADLETIKSAGYADDVKSLTEFFRSHTVTDADKSRINALIKRLGDESFEGREAASEEMSKSGVPAIALLKTAMNAKDADAEIVRRCELALKIIEKVPTRALAVSAARLLAAQKDDTISEVLLNYLPLSEDESVGDEIRNTLAALAVRDGKPDKTIEAALESKEALKRGAAAEAFARANDKASRARMKELLKKETDNEIKLLVALALVNDARDKEIVPDLIRLMVEVPTERAWRAEELLWRIAGEDGPAVSLGNDTETRKKARDEWQKWWDGNKEKVDLAKLDQESSYGLTIVCEAPLRGGLGRVVALGSDGKERWVVKGLNMPTDAVPLAGKRVLIAEERRSRIVERELGDSGKEIWSENINQPVNVGRLPNGVTWAIGRSQIIEWERGDKSNKKQVFTFVRNEFDIVGGTRLKNGEYALLTQQQQLLKVDRNGAVTKTHGIGGSGVNYYATVDALPSGKVLCTLMNNLTEFDLDSGKAGWTANYQYATSAVRLKNGNTLVANQNSGRVVELDKDGKVLPKTEYKGTDTNYRPFRAFKR